MLENAVDILQHHDTNDLCNSYLFFNLKFLLTCSVDMFASVSVSPKGLLHRPIAGSQVPYCPIDKKMSDSWSPIEPSTFKVRGRNYLR